MYKFLQKRQIRQDLVYILSLFFTWKILILFALFYAIFFIQLGSKDRYLGGGVVAYNLLPSFFSQANFDGEHYLSIAIFGYQPLEHAFFPVYPILLKSISPVFLHIFEQFSYVDFLSIVVSLIFSGLFISNLAFLISLVVLFDLIRLDYSKKIAFLTIIILLVFPTSFYFGLVYTESVFLLLSLLSFYFARKKRFFWAGLFGMTASATRVFGILIFFSLLIQFWKNKVSLKQGFWILLIPLGLIFYMFYLWQTTGDPVRFYTLQSLIGEQHQQGIILFPQVVYRYIKILLTVDPTSPLYQTVVLELFTGLLFFILPIYGFFKKMSLSYVFYAFVSFIIPTLQGSFSSSPRYILVIFPSFLALAIFLDRIPSFLRNLIIIISASLLFIESALFFRGYWIA